MAKEKLIIFDTTMRDGEQSPGASMTKEEKIRIARQLERMRVDVIEAGFPASSEGDFDAVKAVASVVRDSTVCGLARANEKDRKHGPLCDAPSFQAKRLASPQKGGSAPQERPSADIRSAMSRGMGASNRFSPPEGCGKARLAACSISLGTGCPPTTRAPP